MNKIVLMFGLLALMATACSNDDGQLKADLSLAHGYESDIVMAPLGGVSNVRFSSAKEWRIQMSGESSWLTVSPLEGKAGTGRIKISAVANETGEVRTAEVNIVSGGVVLPLTVTQENYVPVFELVANSVNAGSTGGMVSMVVCCNHDFEYECKADWLKYHSESSVLDAKGNTISDIVFTVLPNEGQESRTAEISLNDGENTLVYSISQNSLLADKQTWNSSEIKHRSLAMRFTADWCGYCPMMATSFASAKTEVGDKLELVSLHGGQSSYEFDGVNSFINRYKVDGFPTGVVDARAMVQNSASTSRITVDLVNESAAAYPSKAGIACSSRIVDKRIEAYISLYFKEADSYRVMLMLLEDGIVGPQNGAGNDYVHNDITRKVLTGLSGDSVRITGNGEVWTQTYTADITSDMNPDNLKLLVWVEKPYGSQNKVQGVSGAIYGNYGDTYIDNCRVVPVGKDVTIEIQ